MGLSEGLSVAFAKLWELIHCLVPRALFIHHRVFLLPFEGLANLSVPYSSSWRQHAEMLQWLSSQAVDAHMPGARSPNGC